MSGTVAERDNSGGIDRADIEGCGNRFVRVLRLIPEVEKRGPLLRGPGRSGCGRLLRTAVAAEGVYHALELEFGVDFAQAVEVGLAAAK